MDKYLGTSGASSLAIETQIWWQNISRYFFKPLKEYRSSEKKIIVYGL